MILLISASQVPGITDVSHCIWQCACILTVTHHIRLDKEFSTGALCPQNNFQLLKLFGMFNLFYYYQYYSVKGKQTCKTVLSSEQTVAKGMLMLTTCSEAYVNIKRRDTGGRERGV
jgi:hypothetical protein